MPPRAPSNEDFLFHLYRGTELLQDDHVHEAKEELEAALRLRPLDPKSQDLLGVVYFRLGMYPRAIGIFSEIVRDFPDQRTPRLNLALCYLKTGQPSLARNLLEGVLEQSPDLPRAWGYLGLAHERLGEYARARDAFSRGGHDGMARRMDELLGGPPASIGVTAILEAIADARGELPSLPPGGGAPPSVRPSAPPPVSLGAVRAERPSLPPPPLPMSVSEPPSAGFAPSLEGFVRTILATPPAEGRVAPFGEGGALWSPRGPARCRQSVVHAVIGDATISRAEARGPRLGGDTAPLASVTGARALWLTPRTGFRLVACQLDGETVLAREDAVVAFDAALALEVQAFPSEGVEGLLLSGRGALIFEVPRALVSLEVLPGQRVWARPDALIALSGAVSAHASVGDELVCVEGDGVALVEGP
ncbi:MAG: tetratricopeptide repeat protein [Polyangiaceae bacterium]|nr:tetratricopeptide repeat protein [Polyangiaceae bacterium]